MYKTVFQNSRAALIFAGMTILGAVAMVGSPEDQGVLDKVTDRFSQEREAIVEQARDYAETQSVGDVAGNPMIDPAAGWGSSRPVFGEYATGETEAGSVTAVNPSPVNVTKKKNASGVIRGPQPVVADYEGTPVPRPDQFQDQASPPPVPVITSRQMTIEPQ
ncbi:MAG: hypothetical protein CVT77_19600 [Alphaproteobacteria bacterium HGW-Alphaproteobacteria-16]|nr:MAG: hypothetical protein CVT77_19600 [Alphaproteobacteria bacterium HGW-Alphaproteobacteria-16]